MDELTEREKKLSELRRKITEESEPVAGIRLDILQEMIGELNESPVMNEIFGDDVKSNLALISETDFGVFETKNVKLTDSQKIAFLKELNRVFAKYKQEYGGQG